MDCCVRKWTDVQDVRNFKKQMFKTFIYLAALGLAVARGIESPGPAPGWEPGGSATGAEGGL